MKINRDKLTKDMLGQTVRVRTGRYGTIYGRLEMSNGRYNDGERKIVLRPSKPVDHDRYFKSGQHSFDRSDDIYVPNPINILEDDLFEI